MAIHPMCIATQDRMSTCSTKVTYIHRMTWCRRTSTMRFARSRLLDAKASKPSPPARDEVSMPTLASRLLDMPLHAPGPPRADLRSPCPMWRSGHFSLQDHLTEREHDDHQSQPRPDLPPMRLPRPRPPPDRRRLPTVDRRPGPRPTRRQGMRTRRGLPGRRHLPRRPGVAVRSRRLVYAPALYTAMAHPVSPERACWNPQQAAALVRHNAICYAIRCGTSSNF